MSVQDKEKEKDPSVLEHQTDRKENTFNASIPQGAMPEKLAKRDPITLDRFRLYLETILIILNAREIAR